MDQKPDPQPIRRFGLITTVVVDLVSYNVAGIGLGYLAWAKWGAPWWVLLVFSLAGMGMAFYRIYPMAKRAGKPALSPFLWISLLWLLVGQGICWFYADLENGGWMAGFWALSLLNLGVLAKFFSVVFTWTTAIPENRPAYSVQAFSWGLIKLVCVGLFIGVLLQGYRIPTFGLLLGIGTLGVVPIAGGLLWSQRMLENA